MLSIFELKAKRAELAEARRYRACLDAKIQEENAVLKERVWKIEMRNKELLNHIEMQDNELLAVKSSYQLAQEECSQLQRRSSQLEVTIAQMQQLQRQHSVTTSFVSHIVSLVRKLQSFDTSDTDVRASCVDELEVLMQSWDICASDSDHDPQLSFPPSCNVHNLQETFVSLSSKYQQYVSTHERLQSELASMNEVIKQMTLAQAKVCF